MVRVPTVPKPSLNSTFKRKLLSTTSTRLIARLRVFKVNARPTLRWGELAHGPRVAIREPALVQHPPDPIHVRIEIKTVISAPVATTRLEMAHWSTL